ncbi:hypothetical protein H5410_036414 [Solanum commersonii]|uniref:Uncharacterized protein n=1 Tax=Solanum commersonii TaxID=4109 RepID=A0A9J5Y831_SOLCO|nr:hypothetical protein H5410_036414 [Solanum commersonii]
MSSGSDSDRSRDHLGVRQPNNSIKKKSRRLVDVMDIVEFLSSALEARNTDTHLYVVPFGATDPRSYHTQYHRPHGDSFYFIVLTSTSL